MFVAKIDPKDTREKSGIALLSKKVWSSRRNTNKYDAMWQGRQPIYAKGRSSFLTYFPSFSRITFLDLEANSALVGER